MEITETNMREYFSKIVDHVVSLSAQAKQVEELTRRVDEMSQRISSLEQENYHLKSDLQSQIEQSSRMAQERDATQLELNNSREHAHALAETIILRDSRVTELEQRNNVLNDNIAKLEHDAQVDYNRRQDLELLVSDLRSQLEAVSNERDQHKQNAENNSNEAREYKAHLDRIQSILNPPRPVEDYVSNVA